jgi:hypothetical protein
MAPSLLLGLIVVVPILLIFLLKVNAAAVFMSLCVGEVLVLFLSNDAGTLSGVVSPGSASISQASLKLALLLIPPILTLIFMYHGVKGSVMMTMNVIPAIAVGLVGALLAEPLLSESFQKTLNHSSLWHHLILYQGSVVACAAAVSLVFFLLQRQSRPRAKKRGHKHQAE